MRRTLISRSQDGLKYFASKSKLVQQPSRNISLGKWAEKRVLNSAVNGILEKNDDFLRKGIPQSSFSLPRELPLEDVLNEYRHVDPFKTSQVDIAHVTEDLHRAIGSDHPLIKQVASHFFENSGKFFRPLIVCLMGRALAADAASKDGEDIAPSDRQISLALLTELMHTATLLHDDVIDESATRRGVESVHSVYGNKLAILGGDYLLARASITLARLRNHDVTEAMSTVIEHLVKGEVMQMKPTSLEGEVRDEFSEQVQTHLTKSYYKTASLMDNSCKSCALLMEPADETHVKIASEYGKNIGIAFQLVDDILDFEGSQDLGKPTLNDLKQGMSTLPTLIASNEFPALSVLMKRKFKQDGDVETAVEFVNKANGIERSRVIADEFGAHAVAAVLQLRDSPARGALISLVQRVLRRDK